MNLLENNRISSAPNSLSLSKEFSWTFFLLSPRSLSLALLPSPFFLSKILSKPLNNRKRFAARTIVPHSFIWLHYLYNLIETASYPTTIEVVLFGRIAINFQSCLIPIWQISSKCIKSCFFFRRNLYRKSAIEIVYLKIPELVETQCIHESQFLFNCQY